MANNWDLNPDYHKVRYFPRTEIDKLLKRVHKFVKNEAASVHSISMDSEYAYDEETGEGGIYWNAIVVYGPIYKENNNVEA